MQSFGQACIFLDSIPNAFNVFFSSHIDKGNSLFRGNISPTIPKSFEKLLSDHPYHAFRLYNFTKVCNFVKFLQPGYKCFWASSSNVSKKSGSFL